mgnify:CR=1 FL=1
MQENDLEMITNIPQEMVPVIRDVAKSISDFGDKSGQKLSEWIICARNSEKAS